MGKPISNIPICQFAPKEPPDTMIYTSNQCPIKITKPTNINTPASLFASLDIKINIGNTKFIKNIPKYKYL